MMIHLVSYFVARVPFTRCKRYVDGKEVTAYPSEVTCAKCREFIK